MFVIITRRILLRIRNVSDKSRREDLNIYFVLNLFFFWKSYRLWDDVEKYFRDRQATHDNVMLRRQGALCLSDSWRCVKDRLSSYVYWTVRRLDGWIKMEKLDVTCFIISQFTAQHVSNVSTSIFRSLRLIVDLFHMLYFSGSMCVGVTVWFGWVEW